MRDWTRIGRLMVMLAAVVIVIAGMRAASSLLNALFLAILLLTVCLPVKQALVRRGLQHGPAFVVTFLVSVVIGILVVAFIVFSIAQVAGDLPVYEEQIDQLVSTVETQVEGLGVDVDSMLQVENVPVDSVLSSLRGIFGSALSIVSLILLSYLFLLYMLWDSRGLAQRVRGVLGADHPLVTRTGQFMVSSQRYLVSRTALGAVIAILQTILMLAMGIDFALLWGFLSLICNYIPNIGFIIGLIPPAAILFLDQGIGATIVFIVIYSVINNVVESFITPRFIGTQVNMSPLATFFAVAFWSFVLGPMGAILGVPVTLFIKQVLIESDSDLSAVSALLSAEVPEPVAADSVEPASST
jgi:predicted PurR-regulated permease PerM